MRFLIERLSPTLVVPNDSHRPPKTDHILLAPSSGERSHCIWAIDDRPPEVAVKRVPGRPRVEEVLDVHSIPVVVNREVQDLVPPRVRPPGEVVLPRRIANPIQGQLAQP